MIKIKLNELLKENNLTINELSKKTGIGRPSLTQLANNKSKMIQFSTLEKLMSFFEVDLFELIEDVQSGKISIIFQKADEKLNTLNFKIEFDAEDSSQSYWIKYELSFIEVDKNEQVFYIANAKLIDKNFNINLSLSDNFSDMNKLIEGIPEGTIYQLIEQILIAYKKHLDTSIFNFKRDEIFQSRKVIYTFFESIPAFSKAFYVSYDDQWNECSFTPIYQSEYEASTYQGDSFQHDFEPFTVITFDQIKNG